MQVIIQSPRVKIREELLQLIHEKVDHLQKINRRITRSQVLLKKENAVNGRKFCVEIQLNVSRNTLFASEVGDSFEMALYNVISNIEGQLRRVKETLIQNKISDSNHPFSVWAESE